MAQTSGTTNACYSISFVDNNVWAAGDFVILNSTNEGITWSTKLSGSYSFNSIKFFNINTGFAISDGGGNSNAKIVKTINGGINWTVDSVTANSVHLLSSSYCVNVNVGWIVGGNGLILKTSNSGDTWVNQASGVTESLESVYFLNSSTGWISGYNGTILRTTNGGINWLLTSTTDSLLSSIHFVNTSIGWGVGQYGRILKTTNGGINWFNQNYGNDRLLSCYFLDINTGWISGYNGTILRTTNSGNNWLVQTSGTNQQLWCINFLNLTTGYTVGNSGTILKTINGGVGIKVLLSQIPTEFSLSQNYPNPFNPSTKINFALPVKSFVKLKVYNSIGKEVANLVNENLSVGIYEYEFNGENLSSGMYFFKLETENFSETKKMILIK